MRDRKRDAQTSGKKLIVSNTDELGGRSGSEQAPSAVVVVTGDGRTSFDYRVPVDRMPIGYRVPGFLKASTTRSETGGLKSLFKSMMSESDKSTVYQNRKVGPEV